MRRLRLRHAKPPPHHIHDRCDPVKLNGCLEEWTYNHHGHRDGFVVAGGMLVRFPPHRAHDVRECVQLGDDVTIYGDEHTPPAGDTHLDAHLIETARGRLSIEVAAQSIGGRLHVTNAPIAIDDDAPPYASSASHASHADHPSPDTADPGTSAPAI